MKLKHLSYKNMVLTEGVLFLVSNVYYYDDYDRLMIKTNSII